MKTLQLLRHAKSSWADPGMEDHDRPLNARGREAAQRIAAYLRGFTPKPQIILCSTSLRTRETLAAILPALDPPPSVDYLDNLYLAPVEHLLTVTRALANAVDCAMLIGHNDGFHDFATWLSDGKTEAHRALGLGLPTGGFVSIELPLAHWSAVTARLGTIRAFEVPRGLA